MMRRTPKLFTGLYRLDTTQSEWQVTHVFEHLVTEGFRRRIASLGYNPDLIGWIDGHTFEDCVYIDAGFYDKKVLRLLDKYLDELPAYSESDLKHAIRVVESEDKVRLTITSARAFRCVIADLSAREWNVQLEPMKRSRVFRAEKSATEFRDYTVELTAKRLTLDEQKLFLRASTLLTDLIQSAIRLNFGGYTRGISRPLKRRNNVGFVSVYTLRRGTVDRHDITDAINEAFLTFDLEANWPIIKKHFETFAKEPLWQTLPLDHYRTTGIVTSNREIARLATLENVASLFQKVSVDVRLANTREKQLVK